MEPGVPGDLVAANQKLFTEFGYGVSAQMRARLDNDFTYHAPFGNQQARYIAIRDKAKELAELIVRATPAGREQSIALTHVEEASMWANAAIARNEKPTP